MIIDKSLHIFVQPEAMRTMTKELFATVDTAMSFQTMRRTAKISTNVNFMATTANLMMKRKMMMGKVVIIIRELHSAHIRART